MIDFETYKDTYKHIEEKGAKTLIIKASNLKKSTDYWRLNISHHINQAAKEIQAGYRIFSAKKKLVEKPEELKQKLDSIKQKFSRTAIREPAGEEAQLFNQDLKDKILGSVDNSSSEARRPAACPRDVEI